MNQANNLRIPERICDGPTASENVSLPGIGIDWSQNPGNMLTLQFETGIRKILVIPPSALFSTISLYDKHLKTLQTLVSLETFSDFH